MAAPLIYATPEDVEALNRARQYGVGKNPTKEDLVMYLEVTAGEINTILLNKGYELPIPAAAANALQILRGINAKGALMQAEKASPSAPNVDRVEKEYNEQLAMLRDAEFSLDAPQAHERARPRGPGLTVPVSTSIESAPFFRRGQEF